MSGRQHDPMGRLEYLRALTGPVEQPARQALWMTGFDPPPVPAPQRLNATVVDHGDGDNVYVDIDLQMFNLVARRQSVRVAGIAANEAKDPGGPEAAAALAQRLPDGSQVVLTVVRWDKWGGRHLAVVAYRGADGRSRDLGSDLVAEGWAVPWNGRGAQPKVPWPRAVAS